MSKPGKVSRGQTLLSAQSLEFVGIGDGISHPSKHNTKDIFNSLLLWTYSYVNCFKNVMIQTAINFYTFLIKKYAMKKCATIRHISDWVQ